MSIVSIAVGGVAGGLVGTAASGNMEAQTVIAAVTFLFFALALTWWYTERTRGD